MEDLGVSRNSVREALKALQALDIVEIRHGYGTYVGQASLTPLVDGLTFRTLALLGDDAHALGEILQVREVLEEGLIRRITPPLTDADLDALEEIVVRMEAAGRDRQPFTGTRPRIPRNPLPRPWQRTRPAAPRRILERLPPRRRSPRLDRRPGPRDHGPPPPRHPDGTARPRCRERPARHERPLPRHRVTGGTGDARGGVRDGARDGMDGGGWIKGEVGRWGGGRGRGGLVLGFGSAFYFLSQRN